MNKINEFPRDLLFPKIPKNAKESIDAQYLRLNEISTHFEEPLDLAETLLALSKAIELGHITENEIIELHMNGVISRNPLNRQQAQFHISCLAYIQAKKYVDSGNDVAAWPLLCHTSYLIGQTETVVAESNEARWLSENTLPGQQLGGKVTSEIYEPIRTRMIELLKKCAPAEGWKTQKQALETIHPELEKFILEEFDSNLTIKDIYNTAESWIKKSGNTEIHNTYLAHAHAKEPK
ncbi:hypothetical protein [Pseudomonas arsenicoxydans]|uniref:Uncharacterized protein n=1 Tax=Pseudomonas arsenicoxydans TaxID=702115 RepID=A0A4P6FYV7_9PSED|nr:hypothetical protein [Pseudomonas arsenicoxydans]QAY84099.1 hypothetical protein CUN61_08915 [Pseudomonas arsenicoxydans]